MFTRNQKEIFFPSAAANHKSVIVLSRHFFGDDFSSSQFLMTLPISSVREIEGDFTRGKKRSSVAFFGINYLLFTDNGFALTGDCILMITIVWLHTARMSLTLT